MWFSASDDSRDTARGARSRHPRAETASPDAGQSQSSVADEVELFERLRDGDEGAIDTLYLAYYERLLRFAYTFVRSRPAAEEVVQDVFLALWQRRASVQVWESGAAYLYTAVRNRALKIARHHGVVERTVESASANQIAIATGEPLASPDIRLERNELAAHIARAIANLPARRRLALTLRWRHQLSYADIAVVMGTSVQAVTLLVSRARDEIAALVREHTGQP